MKILGLSGNVKRPSRTAVLVEAIVAAAASRLGFTGQTIELVDAAPVLFKALRSDQLDAEGRAIVDAVEAADVLVVGSPVYRASYTGALKHLFDLVDYRALTGKRVILAATGGTPLHGLMTEHQLRPLFGFFNALSAADRHLCHRNRFCRVSDYQPYRSRAHRAHRFRTRAGAAFRHPGRHRSRS